jgi:hypothetical protein
MTKVEELEKAVLMLEEQVEQNKTMSAEHLADLAQAKKQLAEVNKPELTPLQFDDINEAVEAAVGNFDFDDSDNYHTEFELDYDAKVTISSFEFQSAQELIEAVVEKVHKLFVEAEELDTTETDNHA